MTWRWLPIGDSFVDFVASRDTDAWISQRELDSVKVWMESNTVFHVMRGKLMTNRIWTENKLNNKYFVYLLAY